MISYTHAVYTGPDCTLMSKVFKVKSSSHSNAAEDEAIANMDTNIDNGCFGIEISKPALGEHVSAAKKFAVQIGKYFQRIDREKERPVSTNLNHRS